MRRLLAILSAVFTASGVLLMWWGLGRWRLPYNEEGRFFDANDGVVYHLQAAELLTLAGGAFLLLGAISWFVSRRRPQGNPD